MTMILYQNQGPQGPRSKRIKKTLQKHKISVESVHWWNQVWNLSPSCPGDWRTQKRFPCHRGIIKLFANSTTDDGDEDDVDEDIGYHFNKRIIKLCVNPPSNTTLSSIVNVWLGFDFLLDCFNFHLAAAFDCPTQICCHFLFLLIRHQTKDIAEGNLLILLQLISAQKERRHIRLYKWARMHITRCLIINMRYGLNWRDNVGLSIILYRPWLWIWVYGSNEMIQVGANQEQTRSLGFDCRQISQGCN